MGFIRSTVVVTLIAVLAVAFSGSVALARAQDAPEEIDFRINKIDCPSDPGQVSPAAGNFPPEGCTAASGVSFTVALEDGTEVATCTTDDSGMCIVSAPNEATVVVTEDVSTATDGYAPRENPITTQVVTEFAGAVFVNVLETPADTGDDGGTGTDGGSATLPDTGTGAATGVGSSIPLYGMLAFLAMAAGAVALRRRLLI